MEVGQVPAVAPQPTRKVTDKRGGFVEPTGSAGRSTPGHAFGSEPPLDATAPRSTPKSMDPVLVERKVERIAGRPTPRPNLDSPKR
jgi:hypothetical protein